MATDRTDDGGFFGPNRNYYWWLYGMYRQGRKIERLGYWAYERDTKRAREAKQRSKR